MTTFKVLSEKFKKAQKEQIREQNKKEKEFVDLEKTTAENKAPVAEINKTVQLREQLKNVFRQEQIGERLEKEYKEKEFKPIMLGLEKVEQVIKQTDEDISKKLDLMPNKKVVEFAALPPSEDEERDKNLRAIIDKSMGVTDIGVLPRKYLPFQDDIFGIHYDDENFYIGNVNNQIIVDDNDLIINNKQYKGTEGLWRLLTNPNKKKLDKETYDTWWSNPDNFTENDLSMYKQILMETHSIYQHNDPSTKKPKSSTSKKWSDLVSKIWKEIKSTKTGSGLIKHHKGPIEYRYIDNLNQLQQRLYYLYAQEQAGNNNFHNEKMGIIKFISDVLEKNVDTKVKGIEYLIRVVNCLPKGTLKSGSGIFNMMLNKLNHVIPELHIPGYNYCGPFTKLDKRLTRGDKGVNKLDEACREHDMFYRDHKDTKERHVADEKLASIAGERMHASDASIGEKASSAIVKAAMKSKVYLGMGVKY